MESFISAKPCFTSSLMPPTAVLVMPCRSVQSCWNCVFSPESPDISWDWIPPPTSLAALPIPLWLLLIVVAKLPTTESIQSPRESTGVVRLLLIDPASPCTAFTTDLTFFLQYMEYNTFLEVSDMEIYADVIFFVNFIFSYVLLYILGKFVNTVKIKSCV